MKGSLMIAAVCGSLVLALQKFGVMRCALAAVLYYASVKGRQRWLRWRTQGFDKQEAIRAAALAIHRVGSVAVFTGAGISVESGIPDFRSAGGLWSRYNPMKYCEYQTFKEKPHLFWQMARELVLETHRALGGTDAELAAGGELRAAKPNAAHEAVAQMESLGYAHDVVTQNIDGLHQAAGSKRVVEVHGTMATCSCMTSGRSVPQSEVLRQWRQFRRKHPGSDIPDDGWVPKHADTGGVLKADVTFFGEALPTGAFMQGARAVLSSSVVLVVGTSLHVMPAGVLPSLMKLRLGQVIVINLDECGTDEASLHIRGSAGEIMPQLVEELRRLRGDTGSVAPPCGGVGARRKR